MNCQGNDTKEFVSEVMPESITVYACSMAKKSAPSLVPDRKFEIEDNQK